MIRNALARLSARPAAPAPVRTTAPVPSLAPAAPAKSATPRVIGGVDPWLFGVVLALIAFGVVMVYSASAVFASQRFGAGHFFLARQGAFALVAVPLMLLVSRIDYHWLRPLTYPILLTSAGLMLYVALGFGHAAGGAARWISVGPVHVQPAETAKVALVLWLAYSLSKKREQVRQFKVGILPHLVVLAVLGLLCMMQPDFGSAVMMAALTFVMLFAAGAKIGPIVSIVLALAGLGVLLVVTSPYRMRRVEAFLDPFAHRQDSGYQIAESIIAFGSGGTTGVGIGDSRQKLFFLPEAHTDFISAIVGEELGFVGICALVLAFVVLVVLGVRIAVRAADDYGTFLAIGITMFVGLQAFTNLAVAMGLVPTKGLCLPFVSYGGSSLLVNAAAVGLLLNVSRPREATEGPAASDAESNARAPRANGPRASAPELAAGGAVT